MSEATSETPTRRKRKRPSRRSKDPKRRQLDGFSPWFGLKNRRDEMHYVWACANGERDFNYYKMLGYHVVEKEEGGAQPRAGITTETGEEITCRDHVLVAIEKEDKADLDAVGHDGNSGQELFDKIEDRILNKESGLADPMRGQHGLRTRNTTKAGEEMVSA